MRSITFAYIAALTLLAGCSIDNDMMLPADVAGYEAFEIEGQISSSINTAKLTVTVTMPYDADLKKLTVSKVKYTEPTRGKESLIAKGDVLNLSDTMFVNLQAFRTFRWKLIGVNASKDDPQKPDEVQLYNMSFDNWTMEGKGWFPYAADASDAEKAIWTTANKSTASMLGKNTTTPEESFLAVAGSGKKAAKLSSEYFLIKFAAGNLFTGEFIGLKGTKGADIAWGVPFSSRPKSLHGYYCYQPVKIDNADDAHKSMIGLLDSAQVQVILADWDKNPWDQYPAGAIDDKGRFHVINSDNQFIDYDNDPAIIGYGNMTFSKWMDNYEEFDLEIKYRNERTPSVVAIVAASSRYGDYFTGGKGTVLYLDEFSFKY